MLERSVEDFDIDVNSADEFSGDTALHTVLQDNTALPRLVAALVKAGSDLLLKNAAGQTPLALAFKATEDQAAALVAHMDDALVDAKLPNGKTLLDTAHSNGQTAAMAALITRGADASKFGTQLASSALKKKDDRLLGALIPGLKQSALDTLDLTYRHLVADNMPRSAAQLLKRTSDDPSAHRANVEPRSQFLDLAGAHDACRACPSNLQPLQLRSFKHMHVLDCAPVCDVVCSMLHVTHPKMQAKLATAATARPCTSALKMGAPMSCPWSL